MSQPECDAPTTSTGPSAICAGRRYSLECSCRIPGSSSAAYAGTFGVRPKVPVATTTLSQVMVSDPRYAVNPPSGRACKRSTGVDIRTGRSAWMAYFSR